MEKKNSLTLKFKVICDFCHEEFMAGDPRTHVCKKKECLEKLYESRRVTRTCKMCNKEFIGAKHSVYCSSRCKQDAQNKALRDKRAELPKEMKECIVCGNPFPAHGSAKTCSDECSAKLNHDHVSKWREDHPDYHMRNKVQKYCIMCGEPVPRRRYLFCCDECEDMHRATELMYRNATKKNVRLSTCKVCQKSFWTTTSQRHFCSEECRKNRGCHSGFKKRRKKAAIFQETYCYTDEYQNMQKWAAFGYPKFDYAESIDVVRITPRICLCTRCGVPFSVSTSDKSHCTTMILDNREKVGKSPCPNCGDHCLSGGKQLSTAVAELKKLYPNFTVMNYRPDWMEGLEIDLYDPERKIGIEYHGIIWHSSRRKVSPSYHEHKADLAEKAGVQLIQIYETEWMQKKDCVIDRLDSIMQKGMKRIPARKLTVKELNTQKERRLVAEFMDDNHIQGHTSAQWAVGLFMDDTPVAVCTFRYGTGYASGGQGAKANKYWELNRYATCLGTTVVGGLSRCIKAFSRAHRNVERIVSFADRRWTCPARSAYSSSGFVEVSRQKYNYMYTDLIAKHPLRSKQYMRKEAIKQRAEADPKSKEAKVYSPSKTETQMATELRFFKLFDAGKIKYELKLR